MINTFLQAISKSCMNCVMHAYALELMRVGGGHGCWDGDDMLPAIPSDQCACG